MSRFSSTGTFRYTLATDDFSGTIGTIYLDPSQMPQYPFETNTFTDRVTYRSKNGRSWMYENYNGEAYTYRWSMLDETCRNQLKSMYDAKGLVNFKSGTFDFGTFRIADSTWKDEEVSHELFDLNFTLEEAFA